jgi:hypothetical protein
MGGTFDEGVSNGGTSAFDDYDADIDGGDRNIADTNENATCAVEDGLSVGGRRSAADDYDGTLDS